MNFNELNRHPRDSRIFFDAEEHIYEVECRNGERVSCESVTTVVENLFEKFDIDYWAERKATADKSAAQIKEEWEAKGREAREKGTVMHDRIERHYLGEMLEKEALEDDSFRLFMEFAQHTHLQPYRTEWRIFSERYRISGTLDFLGIQDDRFVIYDWKRSNKIVSMDGRPIETDRYGKCAKAPISHISDTTFQHYAMQVSLYRYILWLEYGIEVSAGFLGTFHPDYGCPHVVSVPYYRAEVEAILKSRL